MSDDAHLPHEHRRFVAYWTTRLIGGALPARRDIDPLIDLKELAPFLGIIRPVDGRYFYSVLGAGIEEAGGPKTGSYLDETRAPPFRSYLEAMFRLSTERRACVLTRHGFEYDGAKIGHTVRVIAPLGNDGTTVDGFVGLQISRDETGKILTNAWSRTPNFPDALLSEMAWRAADGAWRPVDWRTLQT